VTSPPRIRAVPALEILGFPICLPRPGAVQPDGSPISPSSSSPSSWILYRTPLGLALSAVGDNRAAVDAQGLSVYALRTGAVVAGSALMALGGAFCHVG
jgi:simple sugar transport system permease protein